MQQPKFGQAQQYYQSHQGYSQHPQQYQQYYQNQGQQLANINQKQQQSQQGIPQQQKHMNNLNGANPINPTSYMHSPIAPPSPPIATDVAASQNSSNPLAAGQQQPPQSSNTPPYQQTTIIQNQMNAQNVQMNAHNFNNCNITIMCIHLKNLVGNQFGSSGSATNTASSVGLGTPPSAQQANGSALGGSGMGPNSVPINSNQNLGSMPSVNNSTHSTQSP